MSEKTERELVEAVIVAADKKKLAELAKSEAEKEHEAAVIALAEFMEEHEVEKTAAYAGLGSVTYLAPKLYPSADKGRMEDIIAWMNKNGYGEAVKLDVNAQTLAAIVREAIKSGVEVTDAIDCSYYKKQVRINRA